MKKYLVFTSNNARFVHETDPSRLRGKPMGDFSLAKVKGLPPHFWKQGEGREVLPLTPVEMTAREADIAMHGADNEVYRSPETDLLDAVDEAADTGAGLLVWGALAGAAVVGILKLAGVL
jgi:hypothetical protein